MRMWGGGVFVGQQVSLRIIFACSFGTILEWYDFSLYAYLAPIISLLFFPSNNPFTSIMLTYLVFAVGFLVRPIGAILFGHFGDKIGRKKVLVISMMLMGMITCLIGILPTYSKIGILAPFLLIILRIFQGIVVGGESVGAGSFVIESVPNEKKGAATALVWAGSGVGILFSSIVITSITFFFSNKAMSAFAWRVPFLIGALTGLLGYYVRKNVPESPYFNAIVASKKIIKFPIIFAFRSYSREIFITVGLFALCSMTTYLIFVFMPVYASKNIGLPSSLSMEINTLTMALMVFLVPVFGRLTDIYGRRIFLLNSAIGFLLLSFPLYWFIANGLITDLIVAQIIFAILTACFQGAVLSATLEMFPSNIRYSATAFGLNISYSLFGGTAPMIAIYLTTKIRINAAPGIYLMFGALLATFAIISMPKTNRSR